MIGVTGSFQTSIVLYGENCDATVKLCATPHHILSAIYAIYG